MLKLNILRTPEPRAALCPTCVHVVTHRGFSGEELTCCCLGGTVRELRFAVSECTAYTDRRIAPRERVAGFVRPARKPKPNQTVIRIA